MSNETPPPYIYFKGAVVPWEQAVVHIWSETAIRATNVFEGISAYWYEEERQWYAVALDRHLNRLLQSAMLIRIPHDYTVAFFAQGITELLNALPYRDHMYLRPTIFIERGRYSNRREDVEVGMFITAFPVSRSETIRSERYCVSTWRRIDDLTGIPRAKVGAGYLNFRLPRIEAAQRGFDDAILLNAEGKVSETGGACLFLVRRQQVITPPVTASILESITRALAIDILREEGIEVIERPVDRTELYVTDEIFAGGTLAEIAAVVQIDDVSIADGRPGPVTTRAGTRYMRRVLSGSSAPVGWLTPIPAIE